jgi:hypothetical protein
VRLFWGTFFEGIFLENFLIYFSDFLGIFGENSTKNFLVKSLGLLVQLASPGETLATQFKANNT